MPRAALLLFLASLLTSPASAGPQPLLDPNAALAKSQATGRPVLAIAGSTGCIWCKKMAGELATSPAAQEPAAKFVVLLLDTDDPVRWPLWESRYKVEGDGIPAVFVVRADGEQIYGESGAPQDLAAFLDERLRDAGTVLDDAALGELTSASRTLAKSWRKRDPKEVIPELTKWLDPKNHSAPAKQIAQIVEQMKKFAGDRFAAAERDLQAADRKPDAAFEAAVTVLRMRRDYAGLPELGEDLERRAAALETDPKVTPVLETAAKVFEAESLYENDQRDEAITAVRSLAAEEPGCPAAKYASKAIAKWERETRSGRTKPVGDVNAASSDGASDRAASQLRLGKILHASNPAKARSYFERAIELAPDSPAAAEAKELLGR